MRTVLLHEELVDELRRHLVQLTATASVQRQNTQAKNSAREKAAKEILVSFAAYLSKIADVLPARIDLLDTGSLHGPSGRAGIDPLNATTVLTNNSVVAQSRKVLHEAASSLEGAL